MPDTKTRLGEIRTQTRALRGLLSTARRQRDDARNAFTNMQLREGIDPQHTEEFRAAQDASRHVDELDDQLRALENEETQLLGHIDRRGNGQLGTSRLFSNPETIERIDEVRGGGGRQVGPITIDADGGISGNAILLGEFYDRDETIRLTGRLAAPGTVTVPPAGSAGSMGDRGPIPLLEPPPTFLDTVPTGPMDQRTIPFLRELATEGAAGPTAHGALKPQLGFTFEDDEAVARTFAGWTKVDWQDLEDVARLEQRLRDRALDEIIKSLEADVISGDGTGEHFTGITNTTGLGDIAFDAAELGADLVLDGIVDVLVSGARPNVVALHPYDWRDLVTAKTPGGEYIGAGPYAPSAGA